MVRTLVIVVACALSVPTLAQDCTLENARYIQSDSGWTLTFEPVSREAAANETASFSINLPASPLVLDGGIYRPNGFGSAQYSIQGPCSLDGDTLCSFVEGPSPTVYANTESGVSMIDDEEGARAPRQIVLPQLAESIWYSMYRNSEFGDDVDPSDVFTLSGCD